MQSQRVSRRQKIAGPITILVIVLLLAAIWWLRPQPQAATGIRVAAAKGQLIPRHALPELTAGEELARHLAVSDSQFAAVLAGKQVDFLYARPLTAGESTPWRDDGCASYNCKQVTFYNYEDGGTLQAIINMDQQRLLTHWQDQSARPGASLRLIPKLLAIAGKDERVRTEIGDVRTIPMMMVPMSTWLRDDDCRDDWCIDLTFVAPDGSGRIFHVIVNLHQEQVARTFYTRGREERSRVPNEPQLIAPAISGKPAAQEDEEEDDVAPYENGCHEQYGWNVCWEMTAHDGLDFRDATYDDRLIFNSIKVSQVEAFYPAWPGGYRDEIGFDASVPPEFGTKVTDLKNGFEVRQLFTEPFDWPNCVCCYRYEEIVRFFNDGSFENEFISHGPGCDELASYRPFWRIDLALDEPGNDYVWRSIGDGWAEVEEETELSLFGSLMPDGQAMVTYNDDLTYRWYPERTDPLGADEALLFLLQWDEEEGSGPIETGPADTFRPPRQWIDGDPVSGENIVIWYVPILNTKRGDPWWCMPDPEPEFNPCWVILRAEAGETFDPGLAVATSTPAPAAESGTPTDVTTPGATSTPRPLQGETAPEIIRSAGCDSCHQIGPLGEGGKVGPDLTEIGRTAGQRVPGLDAEEYIRQSILEPDAHIAPDCPNGPCMPGIMPSFSQRLSDEQINTLVTFFLALEETEDEPAAPIGAAATITPASPAPGVPANIQSLLIAGVAIVVVGLLLRLIYLWTTRSSAAAAKDDN